MLLIKNLRQIVQIVNDATTEYLVGEAMKKMEVLSSPSPTLCILIDDAGDIVYVGEESGRPPLPPTLTELDGQGGVALPGFVDAHTHPVFAGCRVHEFAMKLAGATYQEVQAAGGGIHFTTTKTREATEQQLLHDFKITANKMLDAGTTTIEAKSGYGLDEETEMKMLRVLDSAALPLEISATFCGAHAVPRDSSEEKQTELIVNRVIPGLAKEQEAGRLRCVENIDVFCEKGNFGVESTEKIIQAGQAIGLRGNFHAEELSYLGGAEMGARIGCRAMSHLEEISDDGIAAMAEKKCAAVLLPSTAFILRITPPPARKMIEGGVIVALGSDFNPNAHCLAMPVDYFVPMIMSLACITVRLSMEEALVAGTLNSAYSIGRGRTHGALARGRRGDVVVVRAERWEHLLYQLAGHADLIGAVVKGGRIVYAKEN